MTTMHLSKILIHSLVISFSFFGVSISAVALEPREIPSFEEWLETEYVDPYYSVNDNVALNDVQLEMSDALAVITYEEKYGVTLYENSDTQFDTAMKYQEGDGVTQDYHQAFFWFEKSANQGNDKAQVNLAILYNNGKGVRQNYELARKWLLKSANQGNSYAQGLLAVMYEHGKGGRQDINEAKEWFGKSCDNGLQISCDNYRIINQKN